VRSRPLLVTAVLVGVFARLALASTVPGNFDQASYQVVASILDHGGNVYAETARYNYGPIWMYVIWALSHVSTWTGIRFDVMTRAALTLVDLTDSLVIAAIAARAGFDRTRAFLAFFLNPVSILLTGMHGQFEDLAALPLLVVIWLSLRPQPAWKGWPSLLCSLALITKHIMIFSTWMLLAWVFVPVRRAALYFVLACLAFIASFAPFLPTGGPGIMQHVVFYGGIHGLYGLGHFAPEVTFPLFLVVMLALPELATRWHMPLVARMELAAVALVALIPGFGEQYFILPILFASARRSRWFAVYTVAATVAVVDFQLDLTFHVLAPSLLLLNAVWILNLWWLAHIVLSHITRCSNAPQVVGNPGALLGGTSACDVGPGQTRSELVPRAEHICDEVTQDQGHPESEDASREIAPRRLLSPNDDQGSQHVELG